MYLGEILMLKKVQSRTNLCIDVYDFNLRTPTHMEWNTNGRLRVSEHVLQVLYGRLRVFK